MEALELDLYRIVLGDLAIRSGKDGLPEFFSRRCPSVLCDLALVGVRFQEAQPAIRKIRPVKILTMLPMKRQLFSRTGAPANASCGPLASTNKPSNVNPAARTARLSLAIRKCVLRGFVMS